MFKYTIGTSSLFRSADAGPKATAHASTDLAFSEVGLWTIKDNSCTKLDINIQKQ